MVVKTHNLIDFKSKSRYPESNGIVERFNCTVMNATTTTEITMGQAEAIIGKMMNYYNEERIYATLGYISHAGDLASWRTG